jgi:hypothetical protein
VTQSRASGRLLTQSGHRRGDEIDLPVFNAETFFGVALVGLARTGTGRFYSPLGKGGHREAGHSAPPPCFRTNGVTYDVETLPDNATSTLGIIKSWHFI